MAQFVACYLTVEFGAVCGQQKGQAPAGYPWF